MGVTDVNYQCWVASFNVALSVTKSAVTEIRGFCVGLARVRNLSKGGDQRPLASLRVSMIHRFGICRNTRKECWHLYISAGGPSAFLLPLSLFPHSSHTRPSGSHPVLHSATQKFQTFVYTVGMLTKSSKHPPSFPSAPRAADCDGAMPGLVLDL